MVAALPPTRLALSSSSDRIGGAERVLVDLAAGIGRARPAWHRQAIVPGEGPLTRELRRVGVDAVILQFPAIAARLGDAPVGRRPPLAALAPALPATLFAAHRLRRHLQAREIDLLHANGLKASLLGALARPPGTAVVWHLHDYLSDRATASRLLRWLAPRAAALAANSHDVAVDAREVLGERVAITAVGNGVDLDRFRPDGPCLDLDALAGLPAAPPETTRIGLPGLFGRWKGQDVFLRSLALLPPDLSWRGYLIGGAIYETAGSQFSLAELQGLAGELGLAGRIGFTGLVEDVPSALRALDVVVHASTRREPFGLVIAEAMACGRAVVARPFGGAAEVFRTGEVVDHDGTPEDLATKLRLLALEGERRRLLGRAALAAAKERLDVGRFVRGMAALYDRVTDGQIPVTAER